MISQQEKFLKILIIQKQKSGYQNLIRESNFWNFKVKDLGNLAIDS